MVTQSNGEELCEEEGGRGQTAARQSWKNLKPSGNGTAHPYVVAARPRDLHARRWWRQLHNVRPGHIRWQAEQQSILAVQPVRHQSCAERQGPERQRMFYRYEWKSVV